MTRVLRLYHSGVVAEYRRRDALLRDRHGFDARLVTAPVWTEGGRSVRADEAPLDAVDVLPVRGRQHPILFWYSVPALRRRLRAFRPDVVDIHEEPYSLAAGAALWCVARECPQASVCMYSAQNIAKRYPPPFAQLERRALQRASAMYPCSEEAAAVLRTKGYDGDVRVIPLGVTISERPQRSAPGRGLVGFVGRLEHYKGADTALQAFVGAASDLPDAALEIVGDGGERAALERMAAVAGVADRTHFAGAVPQRKALARIAAFDVLLVPSRTTPSWKEQFGRIVAEAFEAGTPVIASDSGSLREVVGDAGILVAEDDQAGFGVALRGLLVDPALWADLSARGRARAASAFSWERVSDEVAAMYRAALATDQRRKTSS